MVAVVSFLVILTISFLVVKIASVALSQTGLSEETARFQARSALTGTGFTTKESEQVVSHPARRKIIKWLMILRSAGLISGTSALVLSFVDAGNTRQATENALWILGGVVALWIFATSSVLDQWISRIVAWCLKRWTDLDTRDYGALLHLAEDYSVGELLVRRDDWLDGRSLGELNLPAEGILVLGIVRENKRYLGAPTSEASVHAGDTLILYGRSNRLRGIDERPKGARGNWEHVDVVAEQQDVVREETESDEVDETARRAAVAGRDDESKDTGLG